MLTYSFHISLFNNLSVSRKNPSLAQFIPEIYNKIIIKIIGYFWGVTNQGTMFTGDEMTYFTKDYDIQLIRSTPFYAQANEPGKASNKVLINILEKMLEDNPID